MNPPLLSTCNHAAIRFVVQKPSTPSEHPWEVAEICGDERCGAVKGVVSHEPNRTSARKTALRLAQQKAEAIGRLVEVRVLAEPGKRWIGYYVARPKSQTTGREILARATGLAILGAIVLSAAFLAAFLLYVYVRYAAFATSITVILLMLPELVQTPRRLVSYAIEARHTNSSS